MHTYRNHSDNVKRTYLKNECSASSMENLSNRFKVLVEKREGGKTHEWMNFFLPLLKSMFVICFKCKFRPTWWEG
ncbi:hypothetical protein LguiA_000485 [Lonicera macranthoides]